MATNFPSSQDSFTNPTSTSSLSSPSHSQQHSDVNDAVEAIQGALLDGAPLHIDDANERIGIGTVNPSSKLEVADSAPTFTLRSSATVPTANTELQAIDFYQSDVSGGAGVSARIVGSASNSSGAQNIEFHTGQAGASSVAERMRIDSNGNVDVVSGELRIGGTAVGEWKTFTPTFNNLSLGASGAVVGRYAEVNDLVFYTAKFDGGGTLSVSGSISLQPPVGTPDSTNTYATSHSGWVRPVGSTIWHCMGFSSGTAIYFYAYNHSVGTYSQASGINVTVPATWNGNGIGYFAGWYAKT